MNRTPLVALALAVAASLALPACGGSSAPRVTTTPTDVAPADGCPMTVAGTSVTVEDTATGAALVFVTTGDVAELRRRIAAWADGHNAHHAAMGPLPTGEEVGGGGHDHHHHHHHGGSGEGGGDHGDHGAAAHVGFSHTMIAGHSRAIASDLDGGARLELVAFPDGIGAMREELRGHAGHLAAGHCAMPSGS